MHSSVVLVPTNFTIKIHVIKKITLSKIMLAFQTKDTDSNFLQQFTFWFYIHFNEFFANI